MRTSRHCLLAIVLGTVASPAQATTIELVANHDATIFENHPDNGSGAGNGLFAGTTGTKSPRRALLSFDLSVIPNGAVIQAVELKLYLGQVAGGGGGGNGGTESSTIEVHRVAAPWGEGTTQQQIPPSDTFAQMGQGEAAEEGDVTWTSRVFSTTAPTLWGTPGGVVASAESATRTVGTTINAPYAWPTTPSMVSDVQGWLNSPATNHGWMLVNQDETTAATFRAFYSRDVATALYHPKLAITYAAPPALTADFNGNHNVDGADFLIWQQGLGILSGATPQMGDATGEGAVTALDLAKWKQEFGMSSTVVMATPEPSNFSLSLGAMCGAAMSGILEKRSAKRRQPRQIRP